MTDREKLADEVDRLAGALRDISIRILSQDNVPDIAGFTCSFIRYQATQGFRIAEWLRNDHVDDVDLIAHATRGLFESALTYAHLMKGGGVNFFKLMTGELAADHFDTMKAYKAICGGSELDEEFEEQLAKYQYMKLKKTPSVRAMAAEAGAENEYSEMYSYYSKYTHPTLYHLVGDYREVYSVEACLIFGDKAVYYLGKIIKDSQKILDIVLSHNEQA